MLLHYDVRFVENTTGLDKFAWPGGYPVYYLVRKVGDKISACDVTHYFGIRTVYSDNGDRYESMRYCYDCAEREFHNLKSHNLIIVNQQVNWETLNFKCECCNKNIQTAYGDDE